MTFTDSVHTAWANLMGNKVRSLFSMLGIVVGTAAVIVVISIVNGTREATMATMLSEVKDILNLRPVYSIESGRSGAITLEEVDKIKKIPHVRTALPEMTMDENVRGSLGKSAAVVRGVDLEYTAIYNYKITEGRAFRLDDIQSRRRVCLISGKIADKVFGIDFPVGQHLRTEKGLLEVIGVFKESEKMRSLGKEGDILVPIDIALRMDEKFQIYSLQIRTEPGRVDLVKKDLQEMIGENPKYKGLLDIDDPRVHLKELQEWGRVWMLQMILIAGISLVVGGIGLMNVMLTTVAERTHEIGLRKALGADSQVILQQFLVEASFLSGFGGIMGILLGVFISYAVDVLSKGRILIAIWPVSIFVSFMFSVFIGILFGLFPASKAARLSPVEALRYE